MLAYALLSDPDASGRRTVLNVFGYAEATDAPEGALDVTALTPRPEAGWTHDGSGFAPRPVPDLAPDALAALKAGLSREIDAEAEVRRLALITPGSGQAMEYQEAYAEAVQVDAFVKANPGQVPDPAPFLMLAASIGIDTDPTTAKPAADVVGAARAVLSAYDAYRRAGAAIRDVRLRAKAAVAAATTAAAAHAAFAAIAWPSAG